jgi:hypothetical protein
MDSGMTKVCKQIFEMAHTIIIEKRCSCGNLGTTLVHGRNKPINGNSCDTPWSSGFRLIITSHSDGARPALSAEDVLATMCLFHSVCFWNPTQNRDDLFENVNDET